MSNKLLNVVKSIGVGALIIGVSGMSNLLYANTVDTALAKGYYNVLTDVIKAHGIYKDLGEVRGNGLVYANLQDFEGDGIPELYMIRSQNDENSIGGYVESIWGYKSGKAYPISSEYNNIGKRRDSRDIYMTKIEGKDYLVHRTQLSHGHGKSPYDNVSIDDIAIYTVKNGKLVKIEEVKGLWESTVDDSLKERKSFTQIQRGKTKTITENTYNNLMKKYTAGTLICYGEAGSPAFSIDTSNGNEQFMKFYKELDNKANKANTSIKDVYSTKSKEEKEQIGRFLSNFPYALTDFNISNYNDHELIKVGQINQWHGFVDLTNGEKVTSSMINEKYYDGFPVSTVDKYVYSLFGVKPDINRTTAKDVCHYYKAKDKYYFPSLEYGAGMLKYGTNIKNMYQLNSTTYCITFDLYEVDLTRLESWEHDWTKPYSNWTSKQKQYEELKGTGYAVVKQVSQNGKLGWNLLEYHKDDGILSNKQLEALQKKYK